MLVPAIAYFITAVNNQPLVYFRSLAVDKIKNAACYVAEIKHSSPFGRLFTGSPQTVMKH